jgi:hypothetical protein
VSFHTQKGEIKVPKAPPSDDPYSYLTLQNSKVCLWKDECGYYDTITSLERRVLLVKNR